MLKSRQILPCWLGTSNPESGNTKLCRCDHLAAMSMASGSGMGCSWLIEVSVGSLRLLIVKSLHAC